VFEPTVSPLMRRARSSTCPRVDAAFRSRRHPPPGCPACGGDLYPGARTAPPARRRHPGRRCGGGDLAQAAVHNRGATQGPADRPAARRAGRRRCRLGSGSQRGRPRPWGVLANGASRAQRRDARAVLQSSAYPFRTRLQDSTRSRQRVPAKPLKRSIEQSKSLSDENPPDHLCMGARFRAAALHIKCLYAESLESHCTLKHTLQIERP